ncbi:MAG: sodium-independent anion transporter, partial [Gaiellaceae bacterium]
EPITDVDTTASECSRISTRRSTRRGISLVFAEMKDPVRRMVERYELTRTIDPEHFFPTLGAAIAAFRRKTSADWTRPDSS